MRFFPEHGRWRSRPSTSRADRATRTPRFARLFHTRSRGEASGEPFDLAVLADALTAARSKGRSASGPLPTKGRARIAPVDAKPDGEVRRALRAVLRHATQEGEGTRPGRPAIVYRSIPRSSARSRTKSSAAEDGDDRTAGRKIDPDFTNARRLMMATDFLLTRTSRPIRRAGNNADQANANRAASLVRQLLAFSRKADMRRRLIISARGCRTTVLMRRLHRRERDAKCSAVRRPRPVKAASARFERYHNLAFMRATPCARRPRSRCARPMSARRQRTPAATRDAVRGNSSSRRSRTEAPASLPRSSTRFRPLIHHQGYRQGRAGLSTVTASSSRRRFVYVDRRSARARHFRIFPRAHPEADEVQATQSARDHRARHRRRHLAADEWCARPHRPTGHGTICWSRRGGAARATPGSSSAGGAYTVIEAGNGVEGASRSWASRAARAMSCLRRVMPEWTGRRCSGAAQGQSTSRSS